MTSGCSLNVDRKAFAAIYGAPQSALSAWLRPGTAWLTLAKLRRRFMALWAATAVVGGCSEPLRVGQRHIQWR